MVRGERAKLKRRIVSDNTKVYAPPLDPVGGFYASLVNLSTKVSVLQEKLDDIKRDAHRLIQQASEVMVCIGRWDLLPPSWEGIHGLYHQPAKAIIEEAERERNLLDYNVNEALGPDNFVGVMTLEQFEEESNNWLDDGHEDFASGTHWVKFVTQCGTIVNGYDRKIAEEAKKCGLSTSSKV